MYSNSFFGNVYSVGANVFQQVRKYGIGQFVFTNIMGKNMKKSLGIQDIAVEQIQGSISAVTTQLGSKNALLARWREKYLQYVQNPYPTVQVYKVGGRYYVEDGYRARIKGLRVIQAEVWELPQAVLREDCCPAQVVRA